MEIGNRSIIRKVNQRAIVDFIIHNEGPSRAEIAKALNLSKPATSENIADLIERGIVFESGIAQTAVGKKGTMLKFNSADYYVMVIDITGHQYEEKILISIYDLSYSEITIKEFDVPENNEMSILLNNIDQWISADLPDFEKIRAIVVSTSGIIKDSNEQHLYETVPTPESYKCLFEEHFHIDTYVYNDINLMAIGEQQFGIGLNQQNVAYIWIDMAVGGAIILNGLLYEGTIGAAGEVGFIPIPTIVDNKISYQFLYDLVSIETLNDRINDEHKQSEYLTHIKNNKKLLSFYDLINGKYQGDAYCVSLCSQVYSYIAQACQILSVLLDLELIIVGGHINLLGDDLQPYIQKELNNVMHNNTSVAISKLEDASHYGAKYLGVQVILEKLI